MEKIHDLIHGNITCHNCIEQLKLFLQSLQYRLLLFIKIALIVEKKTLIMSLIELGMCIIESFSGIMEIFLSIGA